MLFKSDPPHVVLFALWWLSMVWNGHLIDSREMLTVGGHLQFSPLGPINLQSTYSTLKCPLVPPVTPSTNLQSRTTNQQKQVLPESYQTSSWKDSLKVSYFISDPNRILENTSAIPWPLTLISILSFFWRMVEFFRSHRQELLLCSQSQRVVSKNCEKTSGKLPQGQGLASAVRTEGLCYSAGKKNQQKTVSRAGFTTLTPLLKTTIGTRWQKWQLAFIGVLEWTIWRMNSSLVEVMWQLD